MKRNGFTLIELLAVIVVLAIIALIATPIVLNIINNAKTSSNERSGELYVKAVENAIMKKQMSGTDIVEDGEYTVQSDGSICIVSDNACESGTTITIDVEGDAPTEGTITVSNGVVVSYNLVVSGTSVTKGEGSDDSTDTICTLVSGTSKTEGAKYSCKVNDTDTFYFYVLGDENDNYINLIMDRNICDSGEVAVDDSCEVRWINNTDYENAGGENSVTYSKGPLTALKYLKDATSDWNKITYFSDTNYQLIDEAGNYSNISLSGYHARLPRVEDYYTNTINAYQDFYDYYYVNENDYFNGSNEYLFDNMEIICYEDEPGGTEVSCENYNGEYIDGIISSKISHIYGIYVYTLSTSITGPAGSNAWEVINYGKIYYWSIDRTSSTSGIRPVITVEKSKLN